MTTFPAGSIHCKPTTHANEKHLHSIPPGMCLRSCNMENQARKNHSMRNINNTTSSSIHYLKQHKKKQASHPPPRPPSLHTTKTSSLLVYSITLLLFLFSTQKMKASLCVFPNPNPTGVMPNRITQHVDHHQTSSEFQPSDYLMIQDYYSFDQDVHLASQNMVKSHHQNVTSNIMTESIPQYSRASDIKQRSGVMKKKAVDMGLRVAFRTKSKLDVMDDGYKWRKYGKKMVKSSPNPRNYFKCSSGGCNVKKRVERDGGDSTYVITTYEGVHNHESSCAVYQFPSMVPIDGWTLQDSHTPSSS